MQIQWEVVLPPLSVIVTVLIMWWRLDSKIEGVRQAAETAHESIRDDLCDLKVTTATKKLMWNGSRKTRSQTATDDCAW